MNQQCAYDVLLACLRVAAEQFGLPFSEDRLLARLPLDGQALNPELLLQAADRVGFDVEFTKRNANNLERQDCASIVLLKNNKAAVYLPGASEGCARYMVPDSADTFREITLEELKEEFIGYQVLLRPRSSKSTAEKAGSAIGFGLNHWFWGTMWRYRKLYIQLLPASLLVNLFALVMPFFVMIVYDRVVPNQALETLWVLAFGVVLVFLFDLSIRLIRGALLEKVGKEMDVELAGKLYGHLLSLSMRALPASTGNLTSRIRSYETLREFFVSATMLAIADMPFALLMIAAIFYLAGSIGWVLVAASLISIGVSLWIQLPLQKAVRNSAEVGLERQAFIGESVANLEPIKLNNAEGYFQRHMNRLLQNASASSTKSHWYGLLANSLTTTIVNLTSIVVVVAGVYQVSSGLLTMGGLIACVMLASRCMAPMAMLSGLMTRFQQALQSLESLNGVMSLEKEAVDHGQYLQRSKPAASYQFHHATLSYADHTVPALSDINIKISKGEKIALLGRIGSGKSTLLKVMAGLQPITSGSVTVDGFELSQYHPSTLRSVIGYVPQEAALFHGSLRDNIALGQSDIHDELIMDALGRVGLGDFINRHPQGLLGEVGERGSLLSGGQRRAITLARCLVQECPLLLLDEPTANLDPQTEQAFLETLKSYSADRTLVVATHKNSVLELVDRVIVLEQGQVVSDEPVDKFLGRLRHSREHSGSSASKVKAARATVRVNRRSATNDSKAVKDKAPQGTTV
jgi:ATP-binding cassette subfamily C protein LapB